MATIYHIYCSNGTTRERVVNWAPHLIVLSLPKICGRMAKPKRNYRWNVVIGEFCRRNASLPLSLEYVYFDDAENGRGEVGGGFWWVKVHMLECLNQCLVKVSTSFLKKRQIDKLNRTSKGFAAHTLMYIFEKHAPGLQVCFQKYGPNIIISMHQLFN